MKSNKLRTACYVVIASTILAVVVTQAILSMKEAACDGVEPSIPELTVYSGPCASDGNAFAALAFVNLCIAFIAIATNLWIIKRLKL